jgi:hypothetical protein
MSTKIEKVDKKTTTVSVWSKRRGVNRKMVVDKWEVGTNHKGKKIYKSQTKHVAA